MLKITKKVEYALIILKYMGEKPAGEFHSAREICLHFKIPFDTSAKVMQSLNNHDILTSLQGANGGYQLNKHLSDITFLQLEEIIEGKSRDFFCESAKGLCHLYSSCNIVNPVDRLNKKIKNFLGELSISELLFELKLDLPKGAKI